MSKRITGWLVLSTAALFWADSLPADAQGLSGVPRRLEETAPVSFSGKVAGILSSRCGQCHVTSSKGDFRMASFAELQRQGIVTAGDASKSKLFAVIDSDEMPPKKSLPQDEKDTIKRWIDQGAKFDGSNENTNLASLSGARGAASGGPPSGRGGGPPDDEGDAGGAGGYGASMSGYNTGPSSDYGDDMDGMDDMEGYGDSAYGGGGQRANRGRASGTPTADAMETYGSVLTSLLGSMDVSGLFAPDQEINVESGPILKNDAEQAFMAGNHPIALEMMFGHMATEYSDARVALQTVKFSPLLKRPVWNIRWGVSLSVRGDGVTDPSPIKEGATPVRRGGARGGRGGGGGDYGGYEEQMGMDEDYGNGMEDYDGGMEDYGADMESQMQGQMGGRGRGPRGGGSQRSSAPKPPERKMLNDEAKELLTKNLGLVAEIIGEEFDKRFQRGDFGPVFATLTQAPELDNGPGNAPAVQLVPSGSMSAALNDALLDSGEPIHGMWHPGIVFLGEGFSDEMISMAKKENLDLVLHFDVVLKKGRNDKVQNISRCRLLQVAPPVDSQGRARHQVVTSKGIDSDEAIQLASAGRMDEREYVTEQLSSLFAIIDRDVKVVDLPTLPAAVAQRRIASIISGPRARTLRTLAEIRLYQAKDLISEAEAEAAFDIVGGNEGLTLLHGPKRERLETARRWAVESSASAEGR